MASSSSVASAYSSEDTAQWLLSPSFGEALIDFQFDSGSRCESASPVSVTSGYSNGDNTQLSCSPPISVVSEVEFGSGSRCETVSPNSVTSGFSNGDNTQWSYSSSVSEGLDSQFGYGNEPVQMTFPYSVPSGSTSPDIHCNLLLKSGGSVESPSPPLSSSPHEGAAYPPMISPEYQAMGNADLEFFDTFAGRSNTHVVHVADGGIVSTGTASVSGRSDTHVVHVADGGIVSTSTASVSGRSDTHVVHVADGGIVSTGTASVSGRSDTHVVHVADGGIVSTGTASVSGRSGADTGT
ncbi:hypothetical protein J6590_031828 [Homalodisca vitripennis]|nr:hypothetical protein J6590_031828 [Homalodisca vitripennis]